MAHRVLFSLSFDEQHRIIIKKKEVSLDYYLYAITVLFCTITICTTKEKEEEKSDRERDREEKISLVVSTIA
jgi:hypothetical protein